MNRKSDHILIFILFGSFFMGIFTLQIVFFITVLWNMKTVVAEGDWQPRTWLKRNSASLTLWVFMIISAVYQQASGKGGHFDIHWALYACWLLTYRQVKDMNWSTLHRTLLWASTPGLIYSFYWLLRPEMIEWALGGEGRFSMYPRASGFLSNPITHAEALVVLLGWSLARLQSSPSVKEQRWIILHMAASLMIILGSRVRAGMLGFLALLLLHGLSSPKHRKLCLTMVGAMLVIFPITIMVFGFNTESITERWSLMLHSINLLKDNLLFGIGPDRFSLYPLPDAPDISSHPHNTLLGVVTEMGLPGLAFFIGFMAVIAKKLYVLNSRSKEPGGAPAWVVRALIYNFGVFLLLGVFDYNFADTELLIFHGLSWGVITQLAARYEATGEVSGEIRGKSKQDSKPHPVAACSEDQP